MFRVLETWKRQFPFLQDVFADHPVAGGQAPSRNLAVSANSIPRPPSAPPIICTPPHSPTLSSEASLLAGGSIDRSRSAPPSAQDSTSFREPRFHHLSSDVETTIPITIDSSYPGSPSVVSGVNTVPAETTPSALISDLGIPTPFLVDGLQHINSTSIPSAPAINMQNIGSHNQLHVGDDYRDNRGIIVAGGSAYIYAGGAFFSSSFPSTFNVDSTPERPAPQSTRFSSVVITAIIFIDATQQVLGALFGNMITNSTADFGEMTKLFSILPGQKGAEGKLVEEHLGRLMESIKSIMERETPYVRQALREYLSHLWSDLHRTQERSPMATDDPVNVEMLSRNITWKVRLFLFIIHMADHIPSTRVIEIVKNRIAEVQRNAEDVESRQSTKDLPCARAAYDDYVSSNHRRVSCFEGTRQALLEDMGGWVAKPEVGIFVLFGLAGIGKSTIAQTVAERADNVRLLGASFFFSRDEAERRTAQILFTTIASQLCVHDQEFAKAIDSILSTEKGKSAIRKLPLDQLETLILEPLRKLTPRKVVIVIDALDECDDEDAPEVIKGLNKLVQSLPSFRVVLTTRPQPHLHFLLDGKMSQKIFHLHNIEDKIVDGDIELYLRYHLSWEQVRIRLPTLTKPWEASDEDIQLLVRAAGRLFIIASTAVLFILDKTSTPRIRMEKLRKALDQDHTPFTTLNDFYTIVLRSAVPEGCERDTAHLYQTVIGSIMVIQQPLSIHALATLANVDVDDITAVLGNLQSVILLGSNHIPLVYHKSFPDFIQDPARCKEEDLLIDPRFHHTQMALRCLRLLNRCLKYNILDLSYPARFMDNDDALKNQCVDENHVEEHIPLELQYTCLYFANHLESADAKDVALMEELEQFLNSRLLYWLEALSWIGQLDSAQYAFLTLQKQLKFSDLGQIVVDGRRFIGKFYDLIKRSPLHTYHSALPFTLTETSLYKMYSKQMSFCRVLGGQKVWDGLITTQTPSHAVTHIIFSLNNSFFACCMDKEGSSNGSITIHDAVMGMPLGRIAGEVLTIATNFSKAAAFNDGSITLYNVKGATPVATIKSTVTVVELALSTDGSRLLAGLGDATVRLWDTEKCEQIESIGTWQKGTEVIFSLDGHRAAFASCDGVVKLLDGMEGRIIVDLAFPGIKRLIFKFSGDGSRLACLDSNSLKVWNGRDGALIRTAEDVGNKMEISSDGSLLATGKERQLNLWTGNNLALLETLDLDFMISSLAIGKDLIGIATLLSGLVSLYDINSHALVTQLYIRGACSLAFSPDCMRLAVGTYYGPGSVHLWDVPSIIASTTTPQEKSSKPTALAFSLDCLRLASGHGDGTIKLWDTSNMTQLADHQCHSMRIAALAFNVNCREFASGSEDGVIQLWNGKGGEPSGVIKCSGKLTAVALSSVILAAATKTSITLWDLNSRSTVATFNQCNATFLAFSHDLSLLATAHELVFTLWDTAEYKLHTTFKLANDGDSEAWSTRFFPANSQLAVQLANTHFYSLNTISGFKVSENQTIDVHCPSWQGISVYGNYEGVSSWFWQWKGDVRMLHIPKDIRVSTFATGSTMIALGCDDGHILLVKSI